MRATCILFCAIMTGALGLSSFPEPGREDSPTDDTVLADRNAAELVNDRPRSVRAMEATPGFDPGRRSAPRFGRDGILANGNNCATCHQTEAIFSHPIGMAPNRRVPDHLPLVNGRMACVTCHAEMKADRHREARLSGSAMLRKGLTARELCLECHSGSGEAYADLHARFASGFRAHMRSPEAAMRFEPRVGSAGNDVFVDPDDAVDGLPTAAGRAENCLSCESIPDAAGTPSGSRIPRMRDAGS